MNENTVAIKQSSIFKSSYAIFISRFFISLASLLVLYFFAHRLPVVENGAYQSFWAQLNVFNAVSGIGMTLFVFTYTPAKLQSLFTTLRVRHFLSYSVFLLFCGIVFAGLQLRNGLSLHWSVLLLVLFTLCNITDALLAVYRRAGFLIWCNLLYAIGFIVIHLWKMESGSELNVLMSLLLPLLGLKCFFSLGVLFKIGKEERLDDLPIEASELQSMRKLWLHLYLYDMIQMSFLWLDKFIVSVFLSKVQAAVYINGSLNIPFLPLAFAAVSSAALMQLASASSKAQRLRIVRFVGQVLATMAFPLFFFFLFFAEEFIVSFFSIKYITAVPIFICSIMILPLRAYNHTLILQSREQGSVINRGAVLDLLLAVVLMYPLYSWLGLPGIALSFVLSTVVQVIFYFQHSRKLVVAKSADLLPLNNWAIKFLGFGLWAFLLNLLLPNDWTRLTRLSVAALLIGGVAAFMLIKELQAIRSGKIKTVPSNKTN